MVQAKGRQPAMAWYPFSSLQLSRHHHHIDSRGVYLRIHRILVGWEEAEFARTYFGENLSETGIQRELHIIGGVEIFHEQVTKCGDIHERQQLGGRADVLYSRNAMSASLGDIFVTRSLQRRRKPLHGEDRLDVDF